jgi:hypothetical protein
MALAAIAALSMLPVYHRQDDAALLLLAIPACSMLWTEGSRIGRIALLVTGIGLLLVADLPWAIFFVLVNALHLSTSGRSGQMLIVFQVFAIPLTLLAVSVFYLWVYARRGPTLPPLAPM